jgi:hypothetical protein
MTGMKQDSAAAGKTQAPGIRANTRKPWKPKSPVEKFLEAGESLKVQIAEREQELAELRKQLGKFENARKIFEAS